MLDDQGALRHHMAIFVDGEGMRADHVPPELTHDPIAQDVHCLVQCPAAPERMWVQHHNGIFLSPIYAARFA